MAETLPSDNAAIIDVPEVEGLAAEFVYNFFTPDERQNRAGTLPAFVDQKPSETLSAFYIDHTRAVPRMNKLTWNPITIGRRPDVGIGISLQDNFHKIQSEETFTSDRFTTINYQDQEIDKKYRFFARRALVEMQNGRPTTEQQSPFDLATLINNNTPDQITSNFLAEALGIDSTGESHGIKYINPNKNNQFIDESLESLANVGINVRLNNKVLTQIFQSAQENAINVFSNESQSNTTMDQIKQIQTQAVAQSHSSIIDTQTFEFEVRDYVSIRHIDTNGYVPVVESAGYIIDKVEYLPNGDTQTYPPIFIENAFTGVVFDPQVRYAGTYGYRIKAVYFVEIQAQDIQTHQNILVGFLVSSQSSTEVRVTTEEFQPPPPPADFNMSWDYGERALRLLWNLPVNSQRDIKYIQVFRRNTIQEPFALLRMWDFNDSLVNDPSTGFVIGYHETPDVHSVVKDQNVPPRPTGVFLDRDFKKESKFIYAVAAIDAHGFSSPLSIQLEASFDKFANKLIKKLISHGGAPKPYPNAYLNQDAFVDTIKDSGHSKLLVIFNPDFIKLFDGGRSDLKLLKNQADNSSYRLQLINVDLQSQKVVDLYLQDKTIASNISVRSRFSNSFAPITSTGPNFRSR